MEQIKISKKKNRFGFLATLPSILTALLPKFVCPICWPIYAGIVSSLGISLTNYAKYLLPVMIVLLAVSLFALGFKAENRWGFRPLLLGIVASLTMIVGKFGWHSNVALYSGVILLITASVWNAWPKRKSNLTCNACKEVI